MSDQRQHTNRGDTATSGETSASEGGCSDQPPDQPLSVDLTHAESLDDEQQTWLAANATAALTLAAERAGRAAPAGEVRVRVVDDAEMSGLHQRHSGDPETTDVLTFDLGEGGEEAPFDVDIVVCVDVARRESEPRGYGPERELLLYTLHGFLHCLGHDDHDDASFERMHAEEDAVLTQIGVGEIFHARAQTGGGA